MFKVVCLLKKKEGMSLEAFRHHYETSHVPLALRSFPQIKEHRRNYLQRDRAFVPEGVPLPEFDAITELWFEDRAGFEGMLAGLGDAEIAGPVQADEARFLDREGCSMFIVEEQATVNKGR